MLKSEMMDQLTEWHVFCVFYIISSTTLILDRWCLETTLTVQGVWVTEWG